MRRFFFIFFVWLGLLNSVYAGVGPYVISKLKDSISVHTEKILLENDTPEPAVVYFYSATNEEIWLLDQQTQELKPSSSLVRSDWETDGIHSYQKIVLPARSTNTFIIRPIAYCSAYQQLLGIPCSVSAQKYSLFSEPFFDNYYKQIQEKNNEELLSGYIMLGALGFVSLFSIIMFMRYRKPLFLYYFLYGLGNLVLLLLKVILHHQINGSTPHKFANLSYLHLPECAQMLSMWAYIFFLIELLDLKPNYPKLTRFLYYLSYLIIFYGITDPLLLLFTKSINAHELYFVFSGVWLYPMLLIALIWISFKVKHQLISYVIFCNLFLVGLLFVAYLRYGLLSYLVIPGILDTIFTMPFAVLVEMLVFAFAIAYKVDDERKQKDNIEKRVMQVEMMALRSQMNPHFLFNSLNSIRYMVMVNENENASDYLSKFSKLLRMILNHSEKNVIRLSEELIALRLYLDIEKRRLGDNFSYSIMIDEHIEVEALQIPPMLLQPFVENAIWHGLMPSSKSDKRIEIFIKKIDDFMVEFLIKDNGVGRIKAGKLKEKSMKQHQSKGTEITNQRVELFNRNYSNKITISINDLYEHNEPVGTLVRVLHLV